MEAVNHFVDTREWVSVFDGPFVEVSVVLTRSYFAIFLRYEEKS
jgi:hypothetical protein